MTELPMDSTSLLIQYKENPIFCEEFLKSFQKFRDEKYLCDAMLEVISSEDGLVHVIHAHKVVLAAGSYYFSLLFKYNDESKVVLEGLQSKPVEAIVDYFYTHQITITEENVFGVAQAASYLQVSRLEQHIKNFLTSYLNIETCVHIWENCNEIANGELKTLAEDFIADHFVDVYKTVQFQQSSTHALLQFFIASDKLFINTEKDLYEAVSSWVRYDKDLRLNHFSGLLSLVRLPLLELQDLEEILLDGQDLFKADPTSYQFICECLNYKRSEVLSYGNLISKRHLTTRKPKTILFCLGGRNDDYDVLSSMEQSLNNGKTWKTVTKMLIPRFDFSAIECNGKIYVIGGRGQSSDITTTNCEVYDVSKDSWSQFESLPDQRWGFGLAKVDQQLYIVGGMSKTMLNYDIGNDGGWNEGATMLFIRWGHVTYSLDNKIYITGGLSSDGSRLSSCHVFDAATNKWIERSNMNFGRYWAAGCHHKSYLYVAGGLGEDGKTVCSVERYCPVKDQWTALSCGLRFPRSCMQMINCNQRLYVVGGQDQWRENRLDTIEEYDPWSNSWSVSDIL